MEVDQDMDEDDVDFDPFPREGSLSETSSSLTSEAECFEDQPGSELYPDGDLGNDKADGSALPENASSPEPACKEDAPEVEDSICRRTRARYSLANYALEELETFLQESDDDGALKNVDEEEEYRRFLAAVLSGGGDDGQGCQGDDDTQEDEDENDADFELEIEAALESDGDEDAENHEDGDEEDDRRLHTRQKRPKLSRADRRQQSTKSTLRPILPYVSPALLPPGQAYLGKRVFQNVLAPSSSQPVTGASLGDGFTDQQLSQLHGLIHEHVQLMIQTFSLCVLNPSKQDVAADVRQMIIELVGCRDQALARRSTLRQQFCFESPDFDSSFSSASSESTERQMVPLIKSPVISILDVPPLHLALGYLTDVAATVVKMPPAGIADKAPLFPLPKVKTHEEDSNVSEGRSNSVSTTSRVSSGKALQKKSLAATLVENTKKESIALVPVVIARLAQRFVPLFNFSLFPHKPPHAGQAYRVLFTDAEDGLLALGILEYNNDWGAIQKRFLPCKSKHQIYVRQKNRSSSQAPNNPIKDMRRLKASPLMTEEIQRIQEGLKIFKNDWTSIWRHAVPHRDPSLLQRQWRAANGLKKCYAQSEAAKEKRRIYEAKRRKKAASVPDSQVVHGPEDNNDASQANNDVSRANNDASEGVENDVDSYVNSAFLADTENRNTTVPRQLSSSTSSGQCIMMQSGASLKDKCGVAVEQHKINGTKHDAAASNIPLFSCSLDSRLLKRASSGTFDQLLASKSSKRKGRRVVKLAPGLPPVNLPPSVRVMSQVAFQQNATHFNGTAHSAAKHVFTVPPPAFAESVYRQVNQLPVHSASLGSQQQVITNGNRTEDGAEQDFHMHPLLFRNPQEVLSSYSHPVQSVANHSTKYDNPPFEKVPVEKSNNQIADTIRKGTPVTASAIGFHPTQQSTEVEIYGEGPKDDCHQSINRSKFSRVEPPVDDQSTAGQTSTSPFVREDIDLNIDLFASTDCTSANDFGTTSSKSSIQAKESMNDKASVLEVKDGNACSHDCIEEPSEEAMRGIVMEQEELSESEEENQHVEFECEEMDDSEEEQVQDTEASAAQNKVPLQHDTVLRPLVSPQGRRGGKRKRQGGSRSARSRRVETLARMQQRMAESSGGGPQGADSLAPVADVVHYRSLSAVKKKKRMTIAEVDEGFNFRIEPFLHADEELAQDDDAVREKIKEMKKQLEGPEVCCRGGRDVADLFAGNGPVKHSDQAAVSVGHCQVFKISHGPIEIEPLLGGDKELEEDNVAAQEKMGEAKERTEDPEEHCEIETAVADLLARNDPIDLSDLTMLAAVSVGHGQVIDFSDGLNETEPLLSGDEKLEEVGAVNEKNNEVIREMEDPEKHNERETNVEDSFAGNDPMERSDLAVVSVGHGQVIQSSDGPTEIETLLGGDENVEEDVNAVQEKTKEAMRQIEDPKAHNDRETNIKNLFTGNDPVGHSKVAVVSAGHGQVIESSNGSSDGRRELNSEGKVERETVEGGTGVRATIARPALRINATPSETKVYQRRRLRKEGRQATALQGEQDQAVENSVPFKKRGRLRMLTATAPS